MRRPSLPGTETRERGERGIALVIVLIGLTLLLTVAGQFASAMRLEGTMSVRLRNLRRAHARELSRARAIGSNLDALSVRQTAETAALDAEGERLATVLGHATPRLLAAVAVRLMRAKQVSG